MTLTRDENGDFLNINDPSNIVEDGSSPTGIEWAYGSVEDYQKLEFSSWDDLDKAHDAAVVGRPLVAHLITSNAYFEVLFTGWNEEDEGGFSYIRTTPENSDLPAYPEKVLWTGPALEFSKENNSPATDQVTDKVAITRGDDQGIFNSVYETGWNRPGPFNTLWAFGSLDEINSANFIGWGSLSNWNPRELVDKQLIVWLTEENIFLELKFNSWSGGSSGGGFSYSRSTPSAQIFTELFNDAGDLDTWTKSIERQNRQESAEYNLVNGGGIELVASGECYTSPWNGVAAVLSKSIQLAPGLYRTTADITHTTSRPYGFGVNANSYVYVNGKSMGGVSVTISSGSSLTKSGQANGYFWMDGNGTAEIRLVTSGSDCAKGAGTFKNLRIVPVYSAPGGNFDSIDLSSYSIRNYDLPSSVYSNGNFTGVDFTNSDLRNVDFTNADLTGVNFTNADLSGAIFDNAKLTGSIFKFTNLRIASFRGADLSGCLLHSSDLTDADLSSANFTGADLTGSFLRIFEFRKCKSHFNSK